MLKFAKKNWAGITLSILVAVYVITLSYLSIRRHYAFASSFDLANMDQTVWNTANGRFFAVSGMTGTTSRFSYHADLILALLSPFYLIYDRIDTLLFLQSLVIGLAAIPIYLLARDVLKNKVKGLVIASVYLLNPGVQWSNIYDFHGVTMAMAFLPAAFYSAYKKKWNWMFLFSFLTLLTKESASLAVVMLGVYIFIFYRQWLRGTILMVAGAVWFIVTVFYLIPHAAVSGAFWVWNWFDISKYSNDSGVGFDISKILWKFTNIDSGPYYLTLLKPFGFIPLLGFPWFFLAVPDFFINMMSTQSQMRSNTFHYDSIIVVGLVMSTILAWKLIDIIFKKYKWIGWLIGVWLLAVAIRTNYHYSPLPTTPSYWRPMYDVGQDEIAFEKALRAIPKEASVAASSEVRGHITHRENAFNLPQMVFGADYVAMVDQNRIIGDYKPKDFEGSVIEKLLVDEKYSLEFHQGHFYLFKRIW